MLKRRTFLAASAAPFLPRAGHAAVEGLVVIGKDGWLFPVWDEVRHSDPATVHRVTEALNAAVALLKAAHIDVAISLTPAKSRVFQDMLPDDVRWTAEAERRYDFALSGLRQSGAVVPDLSALFMAVRTQPQPGPLFFKADTHWTALGAEHAARLMAQKVTSAVRLPPSTQPPPRLAQPIEVTQERNDLAALLPSAEQARYAFETYPVRQPVESGLLEADTADVLVLGNSYMQPAYGYAAVVAEQLGRPAALFWKVHQMSPYWDLLTYLGTESFKRQRPRLIVWNLAESDMETSSSNPGTWGATAMPPATFLSGLRQLLVT